MRDTEAVSGWLDWLVAALNEAAPGDPVTEAELALLRMVAERADDHGEVEFDRREVMSAMHATKDDLWSVEELLRWRKVIRITTASAPGEPRRTNYRFAAWASKSMPGSAAARQRAENDDRKAEQ